MNDTEKTLDLLAQAHTALTQEVTPSTSKGDRYNCLMIANALRIIERHFCAYADSEGQDIASRGLLPDDAIVSGIRAGHFDVSSPMRTQLIAGLRDRLVRQLAIDNPRFLEQISQTSSQAR